jgi:hypothetical protein
MRIQLAAWLTGMGLLTASCGRQPKPAPPPPAPVPAAAAQAVTNARPQTDAGEANTVHPPDNTVHEKPSKASPNP